MADTSGVDNLTEQSEGSTSLTGIQSAVDNLNTAKQEKGSAVTGNLAAFGSSNVLEDTGKVAPTGTIVGTTDTQTLTNKTLTAPTITNPSTTGTDSGTETLQNKTISSANNTITVTEASISLSDVTTGNVSTTAHGFAPKATNTGTKFLRDDGTYAAPSPFGFYQGQTSYLSTGSKTIAHGLTRVPQFVKITALAIRTPSTTFTMQSHGSASSSASQSCTYMFTVDGSTANSGAAQNNSNIITLVDGGGTQFQAAISALDATNITLNVTTANITALLQVEAIG